MPEVYDRLVKPVFTEKSTDRYAQFKEYTFEVHPEASKPEIRQAIESLFEVKVEKIRTMQQRAKRKVVGRNQGVSRRWKKAYIRLREGDSLDIGFEG